MTDEDSKLSIKNEDKLNGANRETTDKKVAEPPPSIDAALRFSRPIKVSNYVFNDGKNFDDFDLAKLKIFDEKPNNLLCPVEITVVLGNRFEVSYYRSPIKLLTDKKLGSDDLALVLRIFLLNKVSKLKEKMRVCLDELAKGLLLTPVHSAKKKQSPNEFVKSFFAEPGRMIGHWLSELVKEACDSSSFVKVLSLAAIAAILGLLYSLLAPIFGYPSMHVGLQWILKIMLFFLALFFALLALNFKNIPDRAQNIAYEKTNEKLSEILSELTQTNANVASLNTTLQAVGHVPEMLLRHFDEVLHVKEAVTGLEKIILARQRDVTIQVHHVKEYQERARRAATAAAGGIFIGFFTFEVGERVFKFMHLIHGQDDRSMFFWLTTEAGHFTNPNLVNAQKRLPPELLEAYKNCVSEGGKSCSTVQQTLNPVQIREHFMKQYQQSEMHAYGVLLAITLVVSLIAAAIGWRKPAEEQASGHGGHH